MTNTNNFGYKYAMQLLGVMLSALVLVGCGGAATEGGFDVGCPAAPAEWQVFDVQPGQCVVAWSYERGPDMASTVAARCTRVRDCGLEPAQNVHVDQTPYDGQCNDFAQTGDITRAETETLSVAIRIDDPELARVDVLEGAACEPFRFGRDSY